MKFYSYLLVGLLTLGFTACDNSDNAEPVFTEKTVELKSIDASNYSNWVYVNLETGEQETHRDFTPWFYIDPTTKERKEIAAQGSPADVKIKWHVAFRRELVKTNGGSAIATQSTSLDEVDVKKVQGNFMTDAVETKKPLMIDMTQMMKGIVMFSQEDMRNPVLTGWIVKKGRPMVDLTYTPTNLVYVLRTKDNQLFKLQITDFTNAKGDKGYITLKAVRVK